MTTTLRRTGMSALVVLIAAFTMFGGAMSASAQEDTCYPVPPGGCPTEEPEEVACSDIIAAIEAGDTSLDQNGDGEINEADLPASCTCEELIQAISDGTIDPANLPEGALDECDCDELLQLVEDGALSEDLLPEACVGEPEPEPTVEEEQEEEPDLAEVDTGIDATGLGGAAAVVLLAGASMVLVSRRRHTS